MGGSPHTSGGLGNATTAAASNSSRPVGLVCEPCQAVGWMYAQYDDRWNTPLSTLPTQITDINGAVIDSGGRTKGLATFGLEDGVPHQSVRNELGTCQFHAPQEGRIVCEILAEPVGLPPAELEAQIIADLRAFASEMETAIEPWRQAWEDDGWWGLVGSFFDNVGEGLSSWWEGEGEFWATVWDWLSNLPDLAADAFEGAVTGARQLWENRDKIMSLIQYLAEGLVDEFEDGLEALQELIAAIPGLDEMADILKAAVEDGTEWASAMIEMVRETRVLQVLAGTMIGTLVIIPPNFWTDIVAVASGYLIPEVILAIIFAIIAFFSAGVGAGALAARLSAFVAKVVTKLSAIGPAGAIIVKIFAKLDALIGKMVDLIKSLRSRIAERANGATGEATPVVRRAGRTHRVRCFDVPNGADRGEFTRQLQEQQTAINEMTADEMAYAHTVLDQARAEHQRLVDAGLRRRGSSFTDLLRDRGAQDRARKLHRRTLRDRGYSRTQIAEEMAKVDATHYLDIIAGGSPSHVGIGGRAENRAIGPDWIREGRAAGLSNEAQELRRMGLGDQKMNVVLEACD